MKLFLTFLIFIITTVAEARQTKLAVITSELDKDVMDFYLITNEKNIIDSIRYVQTSPNGSIIDDVSVPAERVMEEGGVVIVERDGYDAVILEVERFTQKAGGMIKLNYLHSGVTKTRNAKYINLALVNGRFTLLDKENNEVNRLYIKANYVRVIGLVGIKEIVTSFSKDTQALLSLDSF
ncbi:MAG: hypothetical protein NDI69_14565 [Bacteriovoracaceae bacterium]|nr:hypothetical protein [Bacteriovoracaceae bacterium]